LTVLSGGFADPATIYSGGSETIGAGGTDLGAQISGGTQSDYGFASGVTIYGGSQVVESGGTATATNGAPFHGAHGEGRRAISPTASQAGAEPCTCAFPAARAGRNAPVISSNAVVAAPTSAYPSHPMMVILHPKELLPSAEQERKEIKLRAAEKIRAILRVLGSARAAGRLRRHRSCSERRCPRRGRSPILALTLGLPPWVSSADPWWRRRDLSRPVPRRGAATRSRLHARRARASLRH
jgi:autotransporter passenger strand-loop-strand repeat protein